MATVKLHPNIKAASAAIVKQAKRYGIKVTITSTVRTKAQQKLLTTSGNKYPVATPGRSQHEYGLAVDMVANPWSGGQEIIAAWWKSVGGYHDWSDAVHFAAFSPQQWAALLGQVEVGPSGFFTATPTGKEDPVAVAVGDQVQVQVSPDSTAYGPTLPAGKRLTDLEAFQQTVLGGAYIPPNATFVSVKAGSAPAFEVPGVNDGVSLVLAGQGWTRYSIPPA